MHWPYPPLYPPGYEPPGIGFFAAMFAVVLVFVVVLIVLSASGRLPEESEEKSDALPKSRQGRNNL
jgi:hypothetical protein